MKRTRTYSLKTPAARINYRLGRLRTADRQLAELRAELLEAQLPDLAYKCLLAQRSTGRMVETLDKMIGAAKREEKRQAATVRRIEANLARMSTEFLARRADQ